MTRGYVYERRAALSPVGTLTTDEMKETVGETFTLLASALASLSEEQAEWKPAPEEWSAAQVGDHVALGTGVVMNVIGLLARGQRPTDEDWDPPPQFKGDAGDLQDVRSQLLSLTPATADLFDQCLATDRLDVTSENSLFGEMSWREWYYFLRLHTYSHLEQIEKIRSSPGFPK